MGTDARRRRSVGVPSDINHAIVLLCASSRDPASVGIDDLDGSDGLSTSHLGKAYDKEQREDDSCQPCADCFDPVVDDFPSGE